MRNSLFILSIIFLLGALLRFYDLGNIPIGFHRDEAFLGYNAYSFLETMRDMTGKFLPLHSESFLYSPMGYSYLSIPFIKLFGLSAFSVRFASFLFGSLTIFATFLLVLELFRQYKHKTLLALLSAFFIAISPWHINFSRTATENVIVVFFITLGVFMYLLWLRQKKLYMLLLAFLFFASTIVIYQAPRAFLPLFIPILAISFYQQLKSKQKYLVALLFLISILVPIFIVLSSKNLSLRIKTVSIFATEEVRLTLTDNLSRDGEVHVPALMARIFHNKVTSYTDQFLQNYFKHFSYDFLFTDQGLPERYRIPHMGPLYVFMLPLLLVGVFVLLKKRDSIGYFLLGWVLLVPVGSALTFDDVPNLQRTLIVFPALSIICALGLTTILMKLKRRVMVIGGGIMVLSVAFYLHSYYIHSIVYKPWIRQDGYKELVEKVDKKLSSYKKVVVTDRESAPTIFFLFYNSYNPAKFQTYTKNSTLRDFDRVSFDKYTFSQEECPLKLGIHTKDTLYVNSGLCNTDKLKVLDVIKREDKSTAFYILSSE